MDRRVAQEQNVRIGEEVGYAIRFEDRTSEKTRIKYFCGSELSLIPITTIDTSYGFCSLIAFQTFNWKIIQIAGILRMECSFARVFLIRS